VAGDADDDQDPQMAVRSQWLNAWIEPQRREGRGDRLLDAGMWDSLRTDEDCNGPRWTIALEDHYGHGGAVAVCGELPGGAWMLDGWELGSRAAAVEKTVELIEDLPRVDLVAGATLLADPALAVLPGPLTAATSTQTREALPLLRELAGQQRVYWDPADEGDLAAAIERCRVVERQTGLVLAGPGRTDLVRAASWALLARAQPQPVPAIY
jgi:hypothetical protein